MCKYSGVFVPCVNRARGFAFAAMLFLSFWCHAEPTACVQVIAWAVNPATGECRQFPTPCDIPGGWQSVSHSGCPAAATDYDGVWAVSEETVALSNVPFRFFMLRVSGSTAVIVLLNSYSWDAYVAAWQGNTAQVTSWDSLGFNRWSLKLNTENSGMIVGESCIGNSTGDIVPLAGSTMASPSTSSLAPPGMPIIASACRVPAGAVLAVRRLL